MADYPNQVHTFVDKQDHVDPVLADHINQLQDELAAIQRFLGTRTEMPGVADGIPLPPAGQNNNVAYILRQLITGSGPIGTVVGFAGSAPPSGWLVCDGRKFDPAIYPNLSQVLGGGNTTPNLTDRFVKGAGGTSAVRSIGGSKVLAIDHLPSHNHSGSTGGQSHQHTHSGWTDGPSRLHGHREQLIGEASRKPQLGDAADEGAALVKRANMQGGYYTDYEGHHTHNVGTNGASNDHTHAIPAQGGGQVFEPQFYALLYIIKAL